MSSPRKLDPNEVERIRSTQSYASYLPVPVPPASESVAVIPREAVVTKKQVVRALGRLLIKKPAMWLWFTDKGVSIRIAITGVAMIFAMIGSFFASPAMIGAAVGVAGVTLGSLVVQMGMEMATKVKKKVLREIAEMHAEDRGVQLLMDGKPENEP